MGSSVDNCVNKHEYLWCTFNTIKYFEYGNENLTAKFQKEKQIISRKLSLSKKQYLRQDENERKILFHINREWF